MEPVRERHSWVEDREHRSLRTGAHRHGRIDSHGGRGDHGVHDGHDHLIEHRKWQKPVSMISKIVNQIRFTLFDNFEDFAKDGLDYGFCLDFSQVLNRAVMTAKLVEISAETQ